MSAKSTVESMKLSTMVRWPALRRSAMALGSTLRRSRSDLERSICNWARKAYSWSRSRFFSSEAVMRARSTVGLKGFGT